MRAKERERGNYDNRLGKDGERDETMKMTMKRKRTWGGGKHNNLPQPQRGRG